MKIWIFLSKIIVKSEVMKFVFFFFLFHYKELVFLIREKVQREREESSSREWEESPRSLEFKA